MDKKCHFATDNHHFLGKNRRMRVLNKFYLILFLLPNLDEFNIQYI